MSNLIAPGGAKILNQLLVRGASSIHFQNLYTCFFIFFFQKCAQIFFLFKYAPVHSSVYPDINFSLQFIILFIFRHKFWPGFFIASFLFSENSYFIFLSFFFVKRFANFYSFFFKLTMYLFFIFILMCGNFLYSNIFLFFTFSFFYFFIYVNIFLNQPYCDLILYILFLYIFTTHLGDTILFAHVFSCSCKISEFAKFLTLQNRHL